MGRVFSAREGQVGRAVLQGPEGGRVEQAAPDQVSLPPPRIAIPREYLELKKIEAVAQNNKIFYGSDIPSAFLPVSAFSHESNKP